MFGCPRNIIEPKRLLKWLTFDYHPQKNVHYLQHPQKLMLRATLNEGPSSKVQWDRTILLHEGHKSDPHPLDESLRPKSGKLRLNLHGTILEGN